MSLPRDVRLRGLSSEHHHALVLARRVITQQVPWTQADADALGQQFDLEIDPHFKIEEDVLLPALRSAGAGHLVERTLQDHAALRAQLKAARLGDATAARAFASGLTEHVRFEERELFPACETLLDDSVLDDVQTRAPKT